jgi:methanogenic corrinoid protein MtbC1
MDREAGDQLAAEGDRGEWEPRDAGARDRALLKVVERHVLPRLVLRTPHLKPAERGGDGLSENVGAMAGFALASDDRRSRGMLQRLHREGMSFSQLQIGLLAPTARQLNLLWENDDVSFLDVTLAAGNLQRMMRFVALDLMPVERPRPRDKAILIAPAPGEAHGFGAAMAAEFFRRDGWRVHHESRPTPERLCAAVSSTWVDVVGLSTSAEASARPLRETVRQIRAASRNPRLLVIAAGEAIVREPELLGHIGADATIAALETAPARTHRLVKALFGGD